MGTSSAWTPERRARQAEAIKRWRPWDQSTGPRTEEGKARVAQNGYKGGRRVRERQEDRHLAEMGRAGREMIKLMRAAYAGRNLFGGELLDPDFARSERFMAAQARYDQARDAYWRLVGPLALDSDAAADAIMASQGAALHDDDESC